MEGGKMYRKGLWTEEEDRVLVDYIAAHGKGKWNQVARLSGLKRCGKSCRLRWINYLSPNVKRGGFSEEEEDLIIRLHKLLGNRWSLIAGRVPGRTDNQVKNHWNTHLSKKLGVKKGTFKVSASSKTRPIEVEKKPAAASDIQQGSDSSEAHNNGGGVGHEEDEDGPKPTEDEWSLSESCFWFSDDPSLSGLMGFIDTYSLDFLCH